MSLCEKCSYSELFWSVISRILTEYGEYCVSLRIQSECGKIGSKITPIMDTFYAVCAFVSFLSMRDVFLLERLKLLFVVWSKKITVVKSNRDLNQKLFKMDYF